MHTLPLIKSAKSENLPNQLKVHNSHKMFAAEKLISEIKVFLLGVKISTLGQNFYCVAKFQLSSKSLFVKTFGFNGMLQ